MFIYGDSWAAATKRAGAILAGFGLLLTTHRAAAFDTDPAAIDQSIALTTGSFSVSQYIVDKNYNQFISNHKAPPTRDEIKEWFRLFIAQQTIKARLQQRGYLNRPEIKSAVARISRHILIQAQGPLYKNLYDSSPISVERLRSIHEKSALAFDALIVRFDNEAAAQRMIGQSPARDEALRRLTSLASAATIESEVDAHDGRIAWPYHPFEEVADDLRNAEPGRLIGPLTRNFGVYFMMVRHKTRQAISDFDTVRPGLARYIRSHDELLVRRLRRQAILRSCKFSTESNAVIRLSTRMSNLDPSIQTSFAPEGSAMPKEDPILLATYMFMDKHCRIDASDFARYLNQRFFLKTLRGPAALITALEDMVVEEYDYQAAKQCGLDQSPKFVQDQLNFSLNQALDLYEKETLGPKITLSSNDLQLYYERNIGRYAIPVEATGALYVFAAEIEARHGLSRLLRHEAAAAAALSSEIVDPLVVTRNGPPLFANLPNASLIQLPNGHQVGPFSKSGKFFIFVKRSSARREVPPLAQIEADIRRDLFRMKLNEAELDLFHQNAASPPVRLHLDFSKYGISNPMMENAADDASLSQETHFLSHQTSSNRSGLGGGGIRRIKIKLQPQKI